MQHEIDIHMNERENRGMAIPDAKEVGLRLALLARALQKTHAQLAADIGMEAPAMSNFVNGRHLLTPQWVAKLHARHGANPDWLYLGIMAGLPTGLAERITEAQKTPVRPRRRQQA